MARLAVVTPCFRRDLDLMLELHSSIETHCAADVIHHVVVPHRDYPLFAKYRFDRLQLHTVDEMLPRGLWRIHSITAAIPNAKLQKIQYLNPRHPILPLRGWIIQ